MKAINQKIFFAQNIKFLRLRRKLSQESVADNLNITRAKLAALEVGNTRSPQPEDYIKFSEFYSISIDTLLKVDLSKLGELKLRELEAGQDVYIRGGDLRVLAISVDRANNEQVEYVPVKAKAGYMSHYADPEFIATLPKYSLPHLSVDGTFRIFPIVGDSMLPIPDGSDVTGKYIVDWSQLKPDTPCIVVLKNGQDFVFKLVTLQEDGTFLLRSLNALYGPYTVAVEDVAEIWQFQSYSSRDFPDKAPDMSTLLMAIRDLQDKVLERNSRKKGKIKQ